jgi:hypothetical protein
MIHSGRDVVELDSQLAHSPLIIVIVKIDRVERFVPESGLLDRSLAGNDATPLRNDLGEVELLGVNLFSNYL